MLLLLAVGGLTYALLRNEGGRDPEPGGAPTSSSPATSPPPTQAPSTGPTGTTPTPTRTTVTPTSAPPGPTVLVHVRAVRDGYSGSCPPPEERAPSFAGTLTVSRTPATVEYRWVAESGETSAERGWRRLEFPAGGPEERRVEHTELTHREDDTRRDRIRLEVRSPVERSSDWVAFSVTCEQVTPTGGVTHPGDTPRPQP